MHLSLKYTGIHGAPPALTSTAIAITIFFSDHTEATNADLGLATKINNMVQLLRYIAQSISSVFVLTFQSLQPALDVDD